MASGSKKVIYAALIGNSLIAVTKFVAASITGSSAMFSEGIHSVVDTGNQGLLLLGLRRSKLPPDERFPFGHGKEVYFWSFNVAVMIFGVGAGVSLYEGIHQLQHPEPVTNPMVNYVVLGLAMIFEGFAWTFAYIEFRRAQGSWSFLQAISRAKDPILFVVLFEDSAAMLGLIVAFLGVALGHMTGNPIYDGAASVLIGMILGGTAIWLAYETKGLLIGESANQRVVAGIRELVSANAGVRHVNEVLTLHMGPEFILLTLSIDFDDNMSARELEQCIATLDIAIKQKYPRVKRVFVEAEAHRRSAEVS